MVNLVELNKIIDDKKISKSFIARELNISRQALNNKLKGKSPINVDECFMISHLLLMTDEKRNLIFFI